MTRRLCVIGLGVGGYPVSVLAAKHGFQVVGFEERMWPGGECVQYGCVPSKALRRFSSVVKSYASLVGEAGHDRSVLVRRAFEHVTRVVGDTLNGLIELLNRAGVNVFRCTARLVGCEGAKCSVECGELGRFECNYVVVATGSDPIVPSWVERCRRILTNRELFAEGLPDGVERLAVIGGGVAGVEVAQAIARLGVRVVVFEAMERLLPLMSHSLSRLVARILREDGVEVRTSTPVSRVRCEGDQVVVEYGGGAREVFDAALVLLGRRPRRDALPFNSVARRES